MGCFGWNGIDLLVVVKCVGGMGVRGVEIILGRDFICMVVFRIGSLLVVF